MEIEQSVEKGFHHMVVQLIEASIAAWPEDALMPLGLVEFKKLDDKKALALFQQHFDPYIEGLTKKDEEVLLKACTEPVFTGMDLDEKFRQANDSTKQTLWNYIGHLCRFASMKTLYKYIPENVLASVSEAAAGLKKSLDSGAMSPKDINPMQLGQQVMSQFKPEQIEAMMSEITKDPKAMSLMMTQMASAMESGGGLDSLMNMLQK